MAIYKVQGPDGKIHKFEGPDGASPDEVIAAAQKQFSGLPENDVPDTLGRKAGIIGRAALSGLAALPALPGDLLSAGLNTIAGKQVLKSPSQDFQDTLTGYGMPNPENQRERVASDLVSGFSGGIAGGPMMAASGVAGNMSAGGVRELGGGPALQIGAGIVGGMTPGAFMTAMKLGQSAIGGAAKAVRPYYESGRAQNVGDALREAAQDPVAAAQAARAAPNYVPGSEPALGAASADPGLMGLERASRSGAGGSDFVPLNIQNSQAQNAYLESIAGDPARLQALIDARNTSTGPLRQTAFDAYDPTVANVDPDVVKAAAMAKLMSPEGNQSNVRDAMEGSIDAIDNANNIQNPAFAYETRKDIAQRAQERLMKRNSMGADKLAGGLTKDVVKTLDSEIEKAAPGYQNYMQEYAAQSKPITQMQDLQDISGRIRMAGVGADAEHNISGAKLANILKDPEQLKNLTPDQLNVLVNIQKDLDRSSAINAVRGAGSDTASNLGMEKQISSLLAKHPVLNPLYLGGIDKQKDLLLQALLDRQLGANLLENGVKKTGPTLGQQLGLRAKQTALGGTIGGILGGNN